MKQRLLSLFMTTVMIWSCLPASAMAAPAAETKAETVLLAEAVDKDALRARVEELSDLSNEDGQYPASAWKNYVIFYGIAQSVLANPSATQAEVNGALHNLNYYYDALGPGRPASPSVRQFRLTAEKTEYVQEDDGVFTVQGSAPVTLLPQTCDESDPDEKDWEVLDAADFTFEATNGAQVEGNQVTAAKPGAFTVTARSEKLDQTLTLELTSDYVAAQSVELRLSEGPWLIHERDGQGFKPFRIEDRDVAVKPDNASYRNSWVLSVPDTSGAVVSGRELRVDGAMDALTLTVTVEDPTALTGAASGSFTAAVQYFNPIKSLVLTDDALTVKTGEALALPLTFIGEREGAVSEPGMDWTFALENTGEISITQGAVDEHGVASSEYTLTGVKAGTVTVTGTARDTTCGEKTVSFTVTVKPEKTYPEIAKDRIDQISGQLVEKVNNDWTYGREWEIFGLIRSGQKDQLTQEQIDGYLDSVEAEFRAHAVHSPVIESRVILALGVLDQNAANFRGLDLIDRLTQNPETGVDVYRAATALIALDSLHYFVPEGAVWTREGLISVLLKAQQPDGSLGSVYDTALAVQAMAPYVKETTYAADATEPVDQAMAFLRTDASLSKIFASPADATQMLMTLSALGLDPTQASTGFIRNGENLIDNLEKALNDPSVTLSEADRGLAICALNAYVRKAENKNDVSDLTDTSKPAAYWQLQERVEAASGLNKTDYTADSWAALEQARADAETVFNDPAATESDWIQAHAALRQAMDGLKKRPVSSGGSSEPAKPDSMTTTVEVEAKLDKDGVAVAEMSDAVAKKFAKELAAGKDEAGAQAIVKVKIPQGAKGVSMTLPGAAVEALGETEQTSLAINSEAGSAELSPEALSTAVQASGSGKLTMDIRQTGDEARKSASQSVQASIGQRPVYDVTLTANEQLISQLEGNASIFVPYVPAEGENTMGLTVLYLNEQGEAVELTDARYDPELGGMVFDTTHFSIYAVALRDGGNMPFTDVKTTDWFYDEVGFVYSNRIMNGKTPTKFDPQGATTRGMIVSILWRLEGKPAVSSRMKYRDVPLGTYYTEAVRWASYVGIINGFTPTEFGPNAAISRQQLAAILYRYAAFKGYDTRATGTLSVFRDAAVVSDYSRVPLTWAISKGLMQGRDDGMLVPQGTASRAHVAAILTRFTERVAK